MTVLIKIPGTNAGIRRQLASLMPKSFAGLYHLHFGGRSVYKVILPKRRLNIIGQEVCNYEAVMLSERSISLYDR